MRAIVTPDDLKRGELVPPTWYPVEIVDYEESDAKSDGSTNCTFQFKVFVEGHPYKGNQFKRLFNEKAMGFGKALWGVLGLPFDPVKGYELTTEMLKAQVGKKLEIYVKRGKTSPEFGGKEFNDVQDFRPFSS